MKQPLVLVVQPKAELRFQMTQALTSMNCEVAEAADTSTFLSMVERLQPALVILSSQLPDAFSLCSQIRNNPNSSASILLYLETLTQEIIDRAVECGADDYISGTVPSTLFERRVRHLLRPNPSHKTQEMTTALRESELRYQTLFDHVPVAIFSKDRQGRYTSTNAHNMDFHWSGGPVGHTDAEMFPEDVAQALRAADLWVMQHERELEVEEIIPTPHGIRQVLTRKVPLRNSTGQIEGVLGISLDVTERKKVEQALQESNQRFQALFEYSPDAVFLLQKDATIVDCNEIACQMNGYSRDELIGQSIEMLDSFSIEGFNEAEVDYIDWLRENKRVRYKAWHRHKDGHLFPIEVSTCLVTIGGQELILGIDRDITERRRMEAAEHEQRFWAEALRDTAAALVSTLDLNEVLDRILAQAAQVVPHESSSIALIEGDVARIVRYRGFVEQSNVDFALAQRFPLIGHFATMLDTRQPILIDDVTLYPGWRPIPETSWIRGHIATPIIVRDTVIGFLHLDSGAPGIFTRDHARNLQIFANQVAIAIQNAQYADNLERRVQERTAELQRSLTRERELSDLKSRFVTTVSHEFRTPLSVIMTSSELLKNYYERMTPEQRIDRLARIQTEIINLTALIDEVLTANKTVDNQHQLRFAQVDVFEFCHELVSQLRKREKRDLELIYEGDSRFALLDISLIRNILSGLLSNALKYSDEDETVRLQVCCDERRAIFKVQDYGIGIPDEDQEHIFEVFHRGRNVSHISGIGLGLTIARQAAETHGGALDFESKIGAGSIFTLTIPKQQLKETA